MTASMDNRASRRAGSRYALVLLPWLLAAGGCEVTQVATNQLPPTESLTGQLERGISTRADAERILGHPTGVGGARLPPDWGIREVWFYQSIKINGMHRAAPASGETLTGMVLSADVTQHILLVFFSGDRYDGYMWYSNAGKVEAKTHEGLP
jgi:hypothetical protein